MSRAPKKPKPPTLKQAVEALNEMATAYVLLRDGFGRTQSVYTKAVRIIGKYYQSQEDA